MRIAIDARPLSWTGWGGIGRICRSLIPAIASNSLVDSVTAFIDKPIPDHDWSNVSFSVINSGTIKYQLWGFSRLVDTGEYDIVLSLSPEAPRSHLPTVLLFYDIYSLRYKEFLSWRFRLEHEYWVHWIRSLARVRSVTRRLDGLISVSQTSLLDLQHFGGPLRVPAAIAHPGVDAVMSSFSNSSNKARKLIEDKFGIIEPYVIAVGGINVQKNVDSIVRAYLAARSEIGVRFRLVIVGQENWPRYRDLSTWNDPYISRYASLPDSDLAAFLAGAIAYVNLSLYEGFGLPALEAMAAGTPVIVSNRGALPEVVGSAGIIVDPYSIDTVGHYLKQLLLDNDFRESKRRDSLNRARDFTWESMATDIIELLKLVQDNLD